MIVFIIILALVVLYISIDMYDNRKIEVDKYEVQWSDGTWHTTTKKREEMKRIANTD